MDDLLLKFLNDRLVTDELNHQMGRMARHIHTRFKHLCDFFIPYDDFLQECWLILLQEKNEEIIIGFRYFYRAFKNRGYRLLENLISKKIECVDSYCELKGIKRPKYITPPIPQMRRNLKVEARAIAAGLHPSTVQRRVERGMTIEEAINTPLAPNQGRFTSEIDPKSFRQRAIAAGVKPKTAWMRLKYYGYTIEEALTPGWRGRKTS